MVLSIKEQVVFDLRFATDKDRVRVTTDTGLELIARVRSTLYVHAEHGFVLEPASYPSALVEKAEQLAKHFSQPEMRSMAFRPFMSGLTQSAKRVLLKEQLLERVRMIGTNQPLNRRRIFHQFSSEPINLGLELVCVFNRPYDKGATNFHYGPQFELDIPNFGQSPLLWYSNAKIVGITALEPVDE